MIAGKCFIYTVVMRPWHKANGYECDTADECGIMEEKVLLHKRDVKKIAPNTERFICQLTDFAKVIIFTALSVLLQFQQIKMFHVAEAARYNFVTVHRVAVVLESGSAVAEALEHCILT